MGLKLTFLNATSFHSVPHRPFFRWTLCRHVTRVLLQLFLPPFHVQDSRDDSSKSSNLLLRQLMLSNCRIIEVQVQKSRDLRTRSKKAQRAHAATPQGSLRNVKYIRPGFYPSNLRTADKVKIKIKKINK